MSETREYANASNARRAARQAGYSLDQIELVQNGAMWRYQVKQGAASAESAEITDGGEAEASGESETAGAGTIEVIETAEAADAVETVEANEAAGTGEAVSERADPFAEAIGVERLAAIGEGPVKLVGADGGDYGMCKAIEAAGMAQRLADQDHIDVGVLHTVTDEPILIVHPAVATDTSDDVAGEDDPAAVEGDHLADPESEAAEQAEAAAQTVTVLYERHAVQLQERSVEGLVLTVGGKVVYREHRAPKAARPAKAAKVAKEPRGPKTAPEGKYALVVDLCSRENGATPNELNDLTGWTGAPWKWLLHNPKGTGLAQKYGYEFVASKDGRNVRYFLIKQGAASEAPVVEGESLAA